MIYLIIAVKNPKYTEEKKWNLIAGRMGLQSNGKVSVGTQLKAHYDKILYPFDVWKTNQGKKKVNITCVLQIILEN